MKIVYGAMSSSYEIEAENKLDAYCAILSQYNKSAHLVVIYEPEELKVDNWASFDGKISDTLDELFGGSFDDYFKNNLDNIKTAYKTIKQIC